MRQFIYFVILLTCAILLGSCNCMKKPPITDDIVETDTVEQEYEYVPTVQEVLEQRQELKYALFVDSVYLKIPEQILTNILVTKGTTLSIVEIVEDYISNKEFYHNAILKAMNIQKKYIPDSLPKQPNKSKHLDKPDTLLTN